MSGADAKAKTSDDAQALAALRDALGPFGERPPPGLAEAAILFCAFPQWAVWLPVDGHEWIAARPAGSMLPGSQALMVWVRAGAAGELADLMREADTQLPPDRG